MECKKKSSTEPNKIVTLRKRGRTGYREINRLVWEWYCVQKKSGACINGHSLQREALSIAKRLGITQFLASNGWLQSFRRIHKIVSFLFIFVIIPFYVSVDFYLTSGLGFNALFHCSYHCYRQEKG